MMLAAERVGDDKYSPLGFAPDIRYCNIKNLVPGQTLSIGGDQWLVFPAIQKIAVWNQSDAVNGLIPSSGNHGYAYK